MSTSYKLHVEQDENGMFIWEIPWLPACYTQAKSFSELLERMTEVTKWSINLLADIQWGETKDLSVSLLVSHA